MIEAELKGKIPDLENSEDILTSCIFGLIKYLPPIKGLFPILEKAKDTDNQSIFKKYDFAKYDTIDYFFWESSDIYGIPDLIIIFESKKEKLLPKLILVIEVKYLSKKSRRGKLDQLKDYYLSLLDETNRVTFYRKEISEFKGEFIGLIYLTYFSQDEEIQESKEELKKYGMESSEINIYELKWNEVSKCFKEPINQCLDEYQQKIYQDIYKLLKKKNFISFDGWLNQISDNDLSTWKWDNGRIFYEGDMTICSKKEKK